MATPDTTPTIADTDDWSPAFSEYLLGGIVALMVFGAMLAMVLYLLPPEQLQLPELQPAFRVAPAASIPVNGSRVVRWGNQVVLVVRPDTLGFAAVEGTSPVDGCILHWDPTALRVASACEYVVYDLHGNVVKGVTTVPLKTYPAFVRDDVVYVGRP